MNHRPAAAFDIVDQDVETAEAVDDPLNQACDFFNLDKIGLKNKMRMAGISKVLFQALEFLLPVKLVQSYPDPVFCQGQPDFFADTLDSTQNEGYFSI